MGVNGYDFTGCVSKYNVVTADPNNRVIRGGAFASDSGKTVPLVYNHDHDNIGQVLGHAVLEDRPDGLYAYGFFNNTPAGQAAKESVKHGDINSLSVWANNLVKAGTDVIRGAVRDVSLCVAGANPGAFVESVVAHGMPFGTSDEFEDEAIIYPGITLTLTEAEGLSHSDTKEKGGQKMEDKDKDKESKDNKDEDNKDDDDEKGKTVAEVIDTLTDEQMAAVSILLANATKPESEEKPDENSKSTNESGEGGKSMQHSLFDSQTQTDDVKYLSHSDQAEILKSARACGSLREALHNSIEDGMVLCHSATDLREGRDVVKATGESEYFLNDPDMLFPDYKSLNATPEFISREMGWVAKVMSGVHHTPFTRIKSVYADITEDEARAKGYITGKQKKTEVFTTLKRTTDPTTVYKLQKADRDTILDISDFDVIAWIRSEMRTMLNEEIARAILIGDGRSSDAEDHIDPNHIRPIATDADLFNVTVKVKVKPDATEEEITKAIINSIIKSRKLYKGSGSPKFFTTDDLITEMLLLEDKIGNKIYKTEGEVTTALRVSEMVPVEPMLNQKVTIDSKEYPIIGIMVNLSDYNVGVNKGGEISTFDDFDIDYNQYKYLIETRMSGALVKPKSAITFVYDNSGED